MTEEAREYWAALARISRGLDKIIAGQRALMRSLDSLESTLCSALDRQRHLLDRINSELDAELAGSALLQRIVRGPQPAG